MVNVDSVIVGIFTGAVYSLIAVSITLMYRSTGVLSFAHAGFAMVGAYLYTNLATSHHWPVGVAAGAALVITVGYGLLVERLALRPVSRASPAMKLIATLGVLSLTTGLILLLFGFEPSRSPLLFPAGVISFGSVSVSYQQVAIFAIAAVASVVLGIFLQRTRFGTAVRAVPQNVEAARLMGVRIGAVARFNWGLGALLAGAAGILIAPLQVMTVATFPLLVVQALTASLVGGLASLPLSFVGGLLVGVVRSLTTLHFSSPGMDELATVILVLVLLFARRSWAETLQDPGSGSAAVHSRRVETLYRPLRAAWQAVMSRRAQVTPMTRPVLLLLLLGGAVAAVVVPSRSEYWGFVGCVSLFYVLEALSLVLLVGWGGQVSLMNGAYAGLGAFLTATFVHDGWPLAAAIIAAAAATMIIGGAVGLPALRLTGLQFAIASVAFSGAASSWLFVSPRLIGTLPRGKLFGLDLFATAHLYWVMLPVTAACYLLVWNVRRSTFGALLIASRDAPLTVAHFGSDARRVRMAAFLLASFIAGLGGAFYGVLLTSFQASDVDVTLGIALLLYAVVGGVESLAGPIVAGLLFGLLPQLIQGQSGTNASAWPDVISGVVVVALIALRPQGLASILTGGRAPSLSRVVQRGPVALGRYLPVVEEVLGGAVYGAITGARIESGHERGRVGDASEETRALAGTTAHANGAPGIAQLGDTSRRTRT